MRRHCGRFAYVLDSGVAEGRKLKSGRWRIYTGASLDLIRDPVTAAIATFDSLAAARLWFSQFHPGDDPLREAKRCARCGAYFGPSTAGTLYAGRYYHPAHTPEALDRRRRS